MTVGFVLLTWNRYKFLEQCLEQLIASVAEPSRCEILVMDNGSTDKTPEVLARYGANPMVRVTTLRKNYGIAAYKKLLRAVKTDIVVVVDDDVLTFPQGLDQIFIDYLQAFPRYGYLALNVVQNEFTNGAKPGPEQYTAETIDGKTVERGPTGGWCAAYRRADYRKIALRLALFPLSMKRGEDAVLSNQFRRKLGLESGIIRDHVCFHASGPHYAREYGHLDREIEKYRASNLPEFVETYKVFKEKP